MQISSGSVKRTLKCHLSGRGVRVRSAQIIICQWGASSFSIGESSLIHKTNTPVWFSKFKDGGGVRILLEVCMSSAVVLAAMYLEFQK